jgi:probable phosphoglycerate mutase
MGQIWLVRHGETAWSASGRHTSTTDVPLTPRGEEQARALGPRLDRPWDLVLCSPLQRALRTAQLAGLEPTVEPGLQEWRYGEAEGRTTAELSRDAPWDQWDHPLGESLEELATRVRGVLDRLPDGDVLLVAHGHVLRVLAAVFLGLEPHAARHLVLDPGHVAVLGHEHWWPAVLEWNT